MNPPPDDWPFTGRFYPDGAELVVVHVHKRWIDLCWVDKQRGYNVYLSTKPATMENAK